MPLTPNQRRVINSLPQNQRAIRARQFLAQNGTTQQRQITSATRALKFPRPITISPVAPRVNTNNNSLVFTPSNTVTATTPLIPVTSGTSGDKFLSVEVKPSEIPALIAKSQLFAEYSFTNLRISYIPAVTNTAHGIVLYAFVPIQLLDPTKATEAFALPYSTTTSVHQKGPSQAAIAYQYKDWHPTVKTREAPYKVFVAALNPTPSTTLGFINIHYTIHFRQPLH